MPTSTRAAALAMVDKLHWEWVRAGQRRIQWVSIEVIVERHEDDDALAYTVEHGWIAVASDRRTVTLTAAAADSPPPVIPNPRNVEQLGRALKG